MEWPPVLKDLMSEMKMASKASAMSAKSRPPSAVVELSNSSLKAYLQILLPSAVCTTLGISNVLLAPSPHVHGAGGAEAARSAHASSNEAESFTKYLRAE